ELGFVLVLERLLDAIGAETFDLAADEQPRLVDGIAQCFAGVAEHDEVAGLPHEGREMPDRPLYDDIDALHRDTAPRRGVAIDHEQSAAAGRARALRGVAFHMDAPGHHVFSDALPG